MQNSFGSNVETLHRIMDDQAEALEFVIRDSFSKADIPLSQLSMRPVVLVGAIYRNGRFILPRGADVIKPGDTVLIITTIKGVNDISDFFQ
jgi:trk system potassium uptake protein TrkA